jgi:hypothetical protein
MTATRPVAELEKRQVLAHLFTKNKIATPLKRKQVLRFGIRLNLNMRHPMLKKKETP